MTTNSGKYLEVIGHARAVFLMYRLISSAKDTADLSIGFDRDRRRRPDKLTSNENIEGKHLVKIMLKDVFGFAKHPENAIYGLGYKLTLTWNKDEAVLDKAVGFADDRNKIDLIHFYVPPYIPSIQQPGILSKQIISETHTGIRYV